MSKRITRTNILYFTLGFVLYVSIVFFTVWSDLKSGANYSHLFLRTPSNAIDLSGIEISFHSPWKTETKLVRDSKGIWRIPNKEKRLVSRVSVNVPPSNKVASWEFEFAMDEGPDAVWHVAQLRRSETRSEEYELVLPTRSSLLFPKYGKTVNWKGDSILFLRPGFYVGYSIFLMGMLISALFVHWRTICIGAREICKSFKPSRSETIIGAIALGVFALLNFRNADLPIVMYRQFDELSILRPIETLSFMNSVYGPLFDVISLPFLIPGLIAANFSWEIIGGRLQSAVAMLFVALIFRRILATQLNGTPLTLLSFFPFLVPFFWIMGTLYHPDALMTALLLGSCYFLLKDRGELGLFLYLACFLFAAAVAAKIHALMFAPIIPLYLLKYVLQRRSVESIKSAASAAAVIFISYLVCEPRMLSFTFLSEQIDGFMFQMWTNKTGFDHTLSTSISLTDKLSTISALYSPLVLLALMAFVSTAVFFRQLLAKRDNWTYFYFTNLIVITYYAFFLNKDWSYYYLSPYFLFMALATIQIAILCVKPAIGRVVAVALIALQLTIPLSSWKLVFADYYMPDSQTRLELDKTNSSLMNLLAVVSKDDSFLLSYNVPFDYRALNVADSQIHYLVTDILVQIQQSDHIFLEELRTKYLILSRSNESLYFLILSKFRNDLQTLGYEKIFQDVNIDVYRAKQDISTKVLDQRLGLELEFSPPKLDRL